jgi:hypothetical protein
MAEPTAILGAISASVHLTENILEYFSSFRQAPQEAADLMAEVISIGHLSHSLRAHLERENARGSNVFARTSVLFFAVNGCHSQLQAVHDTLASVISSKKFTRLWRRLEWPLKKKDALVAIKALHRYAQIFHFTVNMDAM